MGLREDMQTSRTPTATKSRGGKRASRRSKMAAAKSASLRSVGEKVRTRKVQDKKDHNVATHSGGKYATVAEMQKAGGVDPNTGRRPKKAVEAKK